MKSVLITGASGFIGGYLFSYLRNKGYKVEALDRMNFYEDVSRGVWRSKDSHDVIIHCAANPNIREGAEPEKIWHSNVKFTHELLEYVGYNKPLFINLSSVAVYGKIPAGYEIYKPTETDQCLPTTTYGMTKLASEFLVNKYTNEERIKGINLRLGGVCGPHMTHGILVKIIKAMKDKATTVPFFNPAPGNQMTYIHVEYIAAFIRFIIESKPIADTYNVCSFGSCSIEKIVSLMSINFDRKLSIGWMDSPGFRNDESVFSSDVSKMAKLVQVPSIEESLRKLVNEYTV